MSFESLNSFVLHSLFFGFCKPCHSFMRSLLHVFKEDHHTFILCMDWESSPRSHSNTPPSQKKKRKKKILVLVLVSQLMSIWFVPQAFARLSAVYGGTYMLNKPECKVHVLHILYWHFVAALAIFWCIWDCGLDADFDWTLNARWSSMR